MHCHGGEHAGWSRWEMGRRGFGRFGGPAAFAAFGNWGNGGQGGPDGFGDNMRIGRMLASGDLRLLALYLIEQQPRHGYDLIKVIEEKTSGIYSPSPGIVYPALTFLEEAGYVTSSAEGNKKLYSITDEGRSHLGQNRQAVESTLEFLGKAGEQVKAWRERAGRDGWGHGRGRHGGSSRGDADRDIPGVAPEVNEARKDLKAAIAEALDDGSEDSQRRLADILRKAAELIRRRNVDIG